MKQYTHIRIMATAALAMSIGLIPLSSALALPQSAASAPDASQTSNERDQPSDGIIVTLTDKAEREILSHRHPEHRRCQRRPCRQRRRQRWRQQRFQRRRRH